MEYEPELKELAFGLRSEGKSFFEISEQLNISKSTASLWTRSVVLSGEAEKAIMERKMTGLSNASSTNREKTDKKIREAYDFANEVVKKAIINPDTARLLCAVMYWCEGVKIRRSNTFGFTNSDPNLVAKFMELFRAGFPIDESKLRLNIHLHKYHDKDERLQFWSKVTTIPLTQCYPRYIKPHTGKRKRENYPGCVTVRYFDTDLARRLETIAIVYLQQGL